MGSPVRKIRSRLLGCLKPREVSIKSNSFALLINFIHPAHPSARADKSDGLSRRTLLELRDGRYGLDRDGKPIGRAALRLTINED